MHQTCHTSVINPMIYAPFNYQPKASQEECYVLDLSKKGTPCLNDTDCYPTPKSSTKSSPSNSECEPLQYFSQIPKFQERLKQKTRNLSQPYSDFSSKSLQDDKATLSDTSSEESYKSCVGSPKTYFKIPRPFNTVPKDSLSLTFSVMSQTNLSSVIIDENHPDSEIMKKLMEDSMTKYAEFRDKILQKLLNPDTSLKTNMRRKQGHTIQSQDSNYLEKRRKYNTAAKKSRDARKNKQDELTIRIAYLEHENIMLKFRIQAEKENLERLRTLVRIEN